MNPLVYLIKMSIEFIMKYISVNGGGNNKKITLFQATIIPILVSIDKTVMSLSHWDQTLWPTYITIRNLDAKTWQS